MSNIKDANSPPDPEQIAQGAASPKTWATPAVPATPIVKVRSQEDIDSAASLVKLQLEQLRLEKETLELEKLKNDILAIRRDKEAQAVAREAVQESLDFEKNTRMHNETYCTHMKGGDSSQMMHGAPAQGDNTSNFAMWQHTLTTGITFRMCSRCGKTWFPKDPDYNWAMRCPTRNSPSTGSPSPGLVRNPKQVRMVSEVPHRAVPAMNIPDLPDYGFGQ
jgi:hypothetical protein